MGTEWLIAGAYLVFSALGDVMSIRWQTAREQGNAKLGAHTASLLGVINWLPFILFVTTQNWQIIVADVLGNWIGSYWGIKDETARKLKIQRLAARSVGVCRSKAAPCRRAEPGQNRGVRVNRRANPIRIVPPAPLRALQRI